MIGCYPTGIFPRSPGLVKITRKYARGAATEIELQRAFDIATREVVDAQLSAGPSYVTDGMLKWQDLLRPFTENLSGLKAGSLARWFNNNTFYRKPIVVGDLLREHSLIENVACTEHLPNDVPWKAILPAPFTFATLSDNRFYKSETELMFKYAQVLNDEIKSLAKLGFKYVQLSDPAIVYEPTVASTPKKQLKDVGEALGIATRGTSVKTCLQTFFGDFSQILPEALEFPVNDLGIDVYETGVAELKEYSFDKGLALGLVDSRNSLVEDKAELMEIAREVLKSISSSRTRDVFICPNCDLEFLPWQRAEEKMRLVGDVAGSLKEESYG